MDLVLFLIRPPSDNQPSFTQRVRRPAPLPVSIPVLSGKSYPNLNFELGIQNPPKVSWHGDRR